MKAIVSNVSSWEAYIADHCLMFLPMFTEEIVRAVGTSYKEYVDAGYLFTNGEFVPGALSIFVHEVDSYRFSSPIVDLMYACIEERMIENGDIEDKPHYAEGEEDVVQNALHATWQQSQYEVVHDMEFVMHKMQLVFLRHDKQIVNSPIKEVW